MVDARVSEVFVCIRQRLVINPSMRLRPYAGENTDSFWSRLRSQGRDDGGTQMRLQRANRGCDLSKYARRIERLCRGEKSVADWMRCRDGRGSKESRWPRWAT